MKVLLDANVILDTLVTEADGAARSGKSASEAILTLCDQGDLSGLIAWHTLPIIAYYFRRQNSGEETALLMDELLGFLHVPTVGHSEAKDWRIHQISDFEDALQISAALAGGADAIITRNKSDFTASSIPVFTPEELISLRTTGN
jgi:predicted nucleic acid-binding protein